MKIINYGIRGSLYSWIDNWLTKRKQRVIIDGDSSADGDVISGVPQGTMLGPMMFLLYINDINDTISSSIRLFANDCVMNKSIDSPTDDANIFV